MTERNPYSPPQADSSAHEFDTRSKPSAWTRFGLTTAWAMAPFILAIVVSRRSDWYLVMIGAAFISSLCGVIAICIPVRRKLVFVGVSMTFGLVIMLLIDALKK